jgi:alkylated DNA nucleotide flippase Atl1
MAQRGPQEIGNRNIEALGNLVRQIPKGRCTSYGVLGSALPKPVSGLLVGKWMARDEKGWPWWRVVGKDGSLLIDRRNPHLALEQKTRLEAEFVPFLGDKVDIKAVSWTP